MKTTLNTLLLFLIVSGSAWGQFQSTVAVSGKHYHDVCIEPLFYNNLQSDFIVAGNLFDSALTSELAFIKRVDENGVVIWNNTYQDTTSSHFRILDVVNNDGFIFATGYLDVGGQRKVFLAQFDDVNGNFTQAKYYDIYDPAAPSFNSSGVHISFTDSDADGDGANDPGFVIAGYFSQCYNIDVSCSFNKGFVLRTDLSLNVLWTVKTESVTNPGNGDYDFANNVTETSNGFVITGSGNWENPFNGIAQQCVLAHKLDFMGNLVWDNSYVFGNSRDVSVDAYYDYSSDKIYMLSNYYFTHSFGITVFDNNGTYDAARSWYSQDPDYDDTYGFTLMPSFNDSSNLIISGYDKNESWTDGTNTYYGESNVFVSEFEKNTGNPVIKNYIYTVENVEPGSEDYNFWDSQIPLMYYPDMSFLKTDINNNNNYYFAGYRIADPSTGDVNLELFKVGSNKENTCTNLSFGPTPFPLVKQNTTITSEHTDADSYAFNVSSTPMPYTEQFCSMLQVPSDSSANCCGGDNLVTNGNFELGDVGFNSGYGTSTFAPGNYAVGNSNTALTNFNATVTDHSYCESANLFPSNEKFMLVNGRTQQANNATIWEQTITGLEPNSKYRFCAYFNNMSQCTFDTLLRVNMRVVNVGASGFSPIPSGVSPCAWVLKEFDFTTGSNTSYTLRIILNQKVNGDGNDLAIDDISLTKLTDPDLSISVEHQGNPQHIVASINTMSNSPTDDVLHGVDCEYDWFVAEVLTYPSITLDWNTFVYGNDLSTTPPLPPLPPFQAWDLTTNFPNYSYFAQNKMYIIGMYTPACGCYDVGFTFQLTLNNRSDDEEVMSEELKQLIIDRILNGTSGTNDPIEATYQINDGPE